ncbi:MAG: cytochrome c4 [Gallionella sp.]
MLFGFLIAHSITASAGAKPSQVLPADTIAQRVAVCVACHGKEGRATNDGYYPRIAGKPEGYLYNQLVNFRDGRRRNAAMTYLVDNLPDDFLLEIAAYFSKVKLPYPPPQAPTTSKETLELGHQLVTLGDKVREIPACIACHGKALTGALPSTPGLLGLPHAYLYAQLSTWKSGSRHATAPDCMAKIANNLSWGDISAVTTYLASQPIPSNAAPATSNPVKPPIECGSIPTRAGTP